MTAEVYGQRDHFSTLWKLRKNWKEFSSNEDGAKHNRRQRGENDNLLCSEFILKLIVMDILLNNNR